MRTRMPWTTATTLAVCLIGGTLWAQEAVTPQTIRVTGVGESSWVSKFNPDEEDTDFAQGTTTVRTHLLGSLTCRAVGTTRYLGPADTTPATCDPTTQLIASYGSYHYPYLDCYAEDLDQEFTLTVQEPVTICLPYACFADPLTTPAGTEFSALRPGCSYQSFYEVTSTALDDTWIRDGTYVEEITVQSSEYDVDRGLVVTRTTGTIQAQEDVTFTVPPDEVRLPPSQGRLESPGHGDNLSGLGFISGWKCPAGRITVVINDGPPLPVAGDQPRADTQGVCKTTNNGFITQMNWALLGDGTHTVVAYDNGDEFARSTFTVGTAGEEFVEGAEARVQVPDFPTPGEQQWFAWNEGTQHLEMVPDTCVKDIDWSFAPTNLRVVENSADAFVLAWDALTLYPNSPFRGYLLYQTHVDSGAEVVSYYDQATCEVENLTIGKPGPITCPVSGVQPGEDYCFQAGIQWGDCRRATSNDVCVTIAEEEVGGNGPHGMTFVRIEPGTFTMGEFPDSGYPSPFTRHEVTISQPFEISTHEVTQAQWEAVMDENPAWFDDCGGDCPVERISWHEAQAFIQALNAQQGVTTYRLPTEAEWEYAARAGAPTAYHFGEDAAQLGQYGWYQDNAGHRTHLIRQKQPNDWGLYDMAGNVAEWVADWYGDYPSSPVADPHGPATGVRKVVRGGAYNDSARVCESWHRVVASPEFFSSALGLRLVRNP